MEKKPKFVSLWHMKIYTLPIHPNPPAITRAPTFFFVELRTSVYRARTGNRHSALHNVHIIVYCFMEISEKSIEKRIHFYE